MVLRALAIWCVLLLAAVGNGAFRESVLIPRMGRGVAHAVSTVLLSAAVKGVPEDTLEAARIDGANERAIFFRVVVPQIWGTVITVYVTTLIGVMKIFDIVYVMTNGQANTNVIGNEFFNQLFTNFNNGAAAAIVVLLMLATIPIMVYQVRNFRREESMA